MGAEKTGAHTLTSTAFPSLVLDYHTHTQLVLVPALCFTPKTVPMSLPSPYLAQKREPFGKGLEGYV